MLIGFAVVLATACFSACSALSSDSRSVYADPRWSPDGSRIVFVDGYYDDVQGYVESGEIVVMNADGSGRKRVAAGYNQFPAWSPDGSRIAFAGSKGGDDDIDLFVIDADGSNRERLTDTDGIDEHSPSWSPDGRAVAYVEGEYSCSLTSCIGGEIMRINANGSDARNLTRTPEIEEQGPVWSPDGSVIAFWTEAQSIAAGGAPELVYVMHADGTDRRRLAPSPSRARETTLKSADSPAWSPDGTMIAFYGYTPLGVYVVKADGSGGRLVAPLRGAAEHRLSWSPDSRRIAFTGGRDDDVFVASVDGTGLRNMTKTTRGEYNPDWSPDGRSIMFTDAWEHIYLMNADGTDLRQLAG